MRASTPSGATWSRVAEGINDEQQIAARPTIRNHSPPHRGTRLAKGTSTSGLAGAMLTVAMRELRKPCRLTRDASSSSAARFPRRKTADPVLARDTDFARARARKSADRHALAQPSGGEIGPEEMDWPLAASFAWTLVIMAPRLELFVHGSWRYTGGFCTFPLPSIKPE